MQLPGEGSPWGSASGWSSFTKAGTSPAGPYPKNTCILWVAAFEKYYVQSTQRDIHYYCILWVAAFEKYYVQYYCIIFILAAREGEALKTIRNCY